MTTNIMWIFAAFCAGTFASGFLRAAFAPQPECTVTEEFEMHGLRVTVRASATTLKEADEAVQRLKAKIAARPAVRVAP